MSNMLDEEENKAMSNGRDVYVINKRISVEKSVSAIILEISLILFSVVFCVVGVICIGKTFGILLLFTGVIFLISSAIFVYKKIKKAQYFLQLEQKLQHDASQIDNYLEQRVIILKNCAKLLDKAIDLDKDTFLKLAQYRSGSTVNEEGRINAVNEVDKIEKEIKIAVENYPEIKAHAEIMDVMQQNSYLQREITATREVYNDTVNTWNREIFSWPIGQLVAAKKGYKTRIPFATTDSIRNEAREVLF